MNRSHLWLLAFLGLMVTIGYLVRGLVNERIDSVTEQESPDGLRPSPEVPDDARLMPPTDGQLTPAERATVLVECGELTGSGVYTSPSDGGYVITAGHVHVDDAGRHHHDCTVGFVIDTSMKPKVFYEATVLHGVSQTLAGQDFAVMRMGRRTGDSHEPFELPKPLTASDEVKVGEAIRTYGFPSDGLLRSSKGQVTGLHGGQVHASGYFYHGWSGGPAVDADNNIVGLVLAYKASTGPDGKSFLCYHYADIREFVKWFKRDHGNERLDYIRFAGDQERAELPGSTTESREERLAKCLTEKGVKLYTAWWCGPCQRQKQMFGAALASVPVVECSDPGSRYSRAECEDADIRAYPTWRFPNGKELLGPHSLSDIAEAAGCEW